MMTTTSRSRTVAVTPLSAWKSPNHFLTPSVITIGSPSTLLGDVPLSDISAPCESCERSDQPTTVGAPVWCPKSEIRNREPNRDGGKPASLGSLESSKPDSKPSEIRYPKTLASRQAPWAWMNTLRSRAWSSSAKRTRCHWPRRTSPSTMGTVTDGWPVRS